MRRILLSILLLAGLVPLRAADFDIFSASR